MFFNYKQAQWDSSQLSLLRIGILYKRNWFGSLMQLFVPIMFITFIFMIRNLAVTRDYPVTQFIGVNMTYIIPDNNSMTAPYLKSCGSQVVAIVTPTGTFSLQLQITLRNFGYNVMMFNSDDEVNSLARDPLYGQDIDHPYICFGITVISGSPNYVYALRYNISNFDTDQAPPTDAKSTYDAFFNSATLLNPLISGMFTMNNMMHNFILRAQTGNNNLIIRPVISPMKQEAYHDDPIYSYLGNSFDMLCLLPLLIVYLRQTSAMLTEKEKKIRQTMKIMGMTGWNYYITWFIRYFAVYLFIHLAGSFILTRAFTTVSFLVVFITFILFDMVLIFQSYFIQVFFTRAKIGVVVALLFFSIQYIASFIVRNSDNPTYQQAMYGSFSPHSAFVSAFRQILYCQSLKISMGITEIGTEYNFYTIGTCWISCGIHIAFWLFLTLYLEQVFPNQWGAKEHPCFCFICSHGKKHNSHVYQQNMSQIRSLSEQQINIEQVQQRYKEMENQNQVIKFTHIKKQFGQKKAVKDLNLTIYNDQIFVLLGHNGAGKTTTISMLTGLLQPTQGRIQVLGYDLSTQLSQIRKKMGVCPQHDTLYDELTVKQHLELFGTFKGYDSSALDQEVEKLIKDVNLEEKTNYLSKDLSGGQKRRLSVAMAFIGGSKLIYLDEPTSGMDTSARRRIWQMMKNYKNNRIIILTTHFMDEADFLGDRICIMNDGKLICTGSTIFLKNRFGVGYNITFVKKDTKVESDPIISIVGRYVTNAKVMTNVSSEITIQLPMEQVQKFAKMFDEIDSKKKDLKIQSYGVSITTLEQVFLKVTEAREQHQDQQNNPAKLDVKQATLDDAQAPQPHQSDQKCKIFRHMKAIFIKRFRVTYRDYKTLAFQFIFPMGIILLALFLMRISFIKDPVSQIMSLDVFQPEGLPIHIPVSGNDLPTNVTTLVNQLRTDFAGKAYITQTADPTVQAFDNNTLFPIKNGGQLKGGLYLGATLSSQLYIPYCLINTRSPNMPFILPNMFAQSITNTLISTPITITVINNPFPQTYQGLQINNAISGFLGAFVFSMALAFKFASIISFIVKQREDKCKHQQIVSGMSIYAYYFGNFIFDFIIYIIVAATTVGLCSAFNINSLIDGDALLATWLLFIIYGLANIPFTYICSFLFTDYGNSQASFYFFNFVAGGIVPTIILVLRLIGDNTAVIGKAIAWPFRLIPAFCFGQGLLYEGSVTLLSIRENYGANYSIFSIAVSLSQIIFVSCQTIVFFLILFFIEWLKDNQKFMRFFSKQASISDTQENIAGDQDVLAEVVKTQIAKPQDYTILTRNLRKVYLLDTGKHKVAVDKLSFTVQRGQVFGLLGVNGAGKSTTFKMLAGQIISTSGDSFFNGMKISDNLERIRKTLGYCPQFDALLQNLTVRQQMELYYDMKSLPSLMRQKLIGQKIQELNLQKYENVLSGTLSGGNKRKLSVACAIIGDPQIIFLDQPSTGMDPQARRFMWKVISYISTIRKQSTVVLTTHSMQEAQALSTRLGIMVQGNFRCLGTPQHIKSKYGEGYELEVKVLVPSHEAVLTRLKQANLSQSKSLYDLGEIVTNQNIEQLLKTLSQVVEVRKEVAMTGSGKYLVQKIKAQGKIGIVILTEFVMIEELGKIVQKFINDKLGTVQVIEHFQAFYRFRLKSGVPIGRVFGQFQQNKQRLSIQQYSIKQATVEQIFNKFASQYQDSQQS